MTVLLKGTNDMMTHLREIPECVQYKNINIKNKYPRAHARGYNILCKSGYKFLLVIVLILL